MSLVVDDPETLVLLAQSGQRAKQQAAYESLAQHTSNPEGVDILLASGIFEHTVAKLHAQVISEAEREAEWSRLAAIADEEERVQAAQLAKEANAAGGSKKKKKASKNKEAKDGNGPEVLESRVEAEEAKALVKEAEEGQMVQLMLSFIQQALAHDDSQRVRQVMEEENLLGVLTAIFLREDGGRQLELVLQLLEEPLAGDEANRVQFGREHGVHRLMALLWPSVPQVDLAQAASAGEAMAGSSSGGNKSHKDKKQHGGKDKERSSHKGSKEKEQGQEQPEATTRVEDLHEGGKEHLETIALLQLLALALRHYGNRDLFRDSDGMDVLMRLFVAGQHLRVRQLALQTLLPFSVRGNDVAAFDMPLVLTSVLEATASNSGNLRLLALQTVANLAGHANTRTSLVDLQAASKLVPSLCVSHPRIQTLACVALSNLAADETAVSQLTSFGDHFMAPVMALIRPEALKETESGKGGKGGRGGAGGGSRMSSSASSGTTSSSSPSMATGDRTGAALALLNACMAHATFCAGFAASNVTEENRYVDALVGLVSTKGQHTTSAFARAHLYAVLAKLAGAQALEGVEAQISESRMVQAYLASVEDVEQSEVLAEAAWLLHTLLRSNDTLDEFVAQDGVTKLLRALAHVQLQAVPHVLSCVLLALVSAAGSAAAREQMRVGGVVDLVEQVLADAHGAQVQRNALWLLSAMTRDAKACTAMAEAGLVERLRDWSALEVPFAQVALQALMAHSASVRYFVTGQLASSVVITGAGVDDEEGSVAFVDLGTRQAYSSLDQVRQESVHARKAVLVADPLHEDVMELVAQLRAKVSSAGMLEQVAMLVAERMGGLVTDMDHYRSFTYELEQHEVQVRTGSNAVHLMDLHRGTGRHRALLFKLLADQLGLPCSLHRSDYSVRPHAWNEYEGAVVDLLFNPGVLLRHTRADDYKLMEGGER